MPDEELEPGLPEPEEEIPEEEKAPSPKGGGVDVGDVKRYYDEAKKLSQKGKEAPRKEAPPPAGGQPSPTSSAATPGGAEAAERMGAGPVGAKPPEKPGGLLSRFFGKGKGAGEGAKEAGKQAGKQAGKEAAKDVGKAAAKTAAKEGAKVGAKAAATAGTEAGLAATGVGAPVAAAMFAADLANRAKNYLVGVIKNPGDHKLFIITALALIWFPAILIFGTGICGFDGCYGGSPLDSAQAGDAAMFSLNITDGMTFPVQVNKDFKIPPEGDGHGFGGRRANGARKHAGIDLVVGTGQPVYAIKDGTVVNVLSPKWCSYCPSNNAAVFIDHGEYVVNYGEVWPVYVKQGDAVKAGQKIGEVSGTTMLHFEMYPPGTTVNSNWVFDQKTQSYFWNRTPAMNPTEFLKRLKKKVYEQ